MKKISKHEQANKIKQAKIVTILVLAGLVITLWAVILSGADRLEQHNEEVREEEAAVQTAEEQKKLDVLKADLMRYIDENELDPKDIGFYIEDLETGTFIDLNGTRPFIAASTYKLPLAMVYYDRINEGGAEAGEYEDLLDTMIVDSDNEAAEYLFENLGGYDEFKRLITAYDNAQAPDAAYVNFENEFTPDNMGHILRYLYQHREEYGPLIKNMKASMPGQFLDKNLNIYFVQKYGSYDWSFNAVGLSLTGHPYSIAVYTTLGDRGEYVIGDLNEICYNYFNDRNAE